MDILCLNNGISGISSHSIPVTATSTSRANASCLSASGRSASSDKQRSLFSTFRDPLKTLWPKRTNGLAIDDAVLVDKTDTHQNGITSTMTEGEGDQGQNGKLVFNISHVNSLWGNGDNDNDNDDGGKEEEVTFEYDRESFSRMLRRVSLSEARLYEMMSHLGNLAYSIPIIESGNLLKDYGLHFVTSSLEKKNSDATTEHDPEYGEGERKEQKSNGYKISASAAYEITIAFASNLHAQTRSILPFKSSNDEVVEGSLEAIEESVDGRASMPNTEESSWSATRDSVTAVVAAKEEQKQALADDLKSTSSPPCEWYICDDHQSCTRFFVIQGSVSIKAWLANLLLDSIQFEGLDILVHRGIYEVAKGIYQQMLPEVQAHWKAKGSNATFRFTGHSLGGSLALLVNLMLLIRKEMPVASMLPVITFGAPSIMCVGDTLLDKLGLPRNHVQAITMHRDVVPQAFSCNCHNQLAEFLKAVNSKIRNHLCLNEQKYIYEPMGELLIQQPDENFSPSHHLLPSGSGLYLLSATLSKSNDTNKKLRVAQLAFLNSPHPCDIILDRSSYGSEGTLIRDHDMKSYLKSLRTVIRQELNQIRRESREKQRNVWWPLVRPHGSGAGIVVGRSLVSVNVIQEQPSFSRILQTRRILEKVW